MKYLITTTVFIVMSFVANKAYACSCSGPTFGQEFGSADIVFIGKIIKVEETGKGKFGSEVGEHLSVTFQISGYWKGSPSSTLSLKTVKPASYRHSCWVSIPEGAILLVYASKGNFSLVCSRTGAVAQPRVTRDLEKLGRPTRVWP